MPGAPLLSIVVPTRNRHFFLSSLVRAVLSFESSDLELVIHDNSSEAGGFEKACPGCDDPRVRYVFDPSPMSIGENFERSVALANGNFVCMIGDDDGVTPALVTLAGWMARAGIDAAQVPVPTYLWPGVTSKLDGAQAEGILRLPRYTGRVEIVSEADALRGVLSSGGFRIGALPSVYQGLVSRAALSRLRRSAGTCFPGPSPDMANAVGLAAVIDRFARVSFPAVISGSSPSSGAAQGARHDHLGEIADRKFLPADTAERWPREVPLYFSGPTLWAATLVHALAGSGQGDRIREIRWDRLYGACTVLHRRYRSRVEEARTRNPGLVSASRLAAGMAWTWMLRAEALAGNIGRRVASAYRHGGSVTSLADIEQVIAHVTATHGHLPVDGWHS